MRILLCGVLFLALAVGAGCSTRHEIESRSQVDLAPVEVKPIHITIDVNIRVERALDDFFGDLDDAQSALREDEQAN